VELEGEGPDECYVNDDCGLFHTECQDEECVLVEGKGDNECMVDDDCVEVEPPNLDCESICAQIPGADFLAQGLSSSTACKNALPDFYPSTTCYTTCRYPWFNRVDNIAGYDSCCCGVVKRFPCDDCPGQNPQCPDPNDICAANEPSWHSP